MRRLGGALDPRRLVLSLPLAFAAPVSSYLLLDAEGPLIALLLYTAVTESLFILRGSIRRRALPTAFLLIFLAGGASTIYAALDITPASAFLAWFKLVREGQAGGTIGYMFCLLYTFFPALFAGLLLSFDPWTAIAGYLFMNSLISAIILESYALAAVAVIILLAFVAYRAFRQADRLRLGSLVSTLQVIAAAALLAFVMTLAMLPNALVDSLFAAKLEVPVARLFPAFPFLYNVPGYGHSLGPSDRGGRPALTSRPVLRVSARKGETLYLRTAVYDTYTGSGWAPHEATKPAAPEAARPKTDGSRGDSIVIMSGRAEGAPIQIEVLIDFLATLPTTLDTATIESLSGPLPPLAYGGEASGYVLSTPITRGFRILDNRLAPSASRERAQGLGDEERAASLQTGNVPERLRALARSLARTGPDSTISAIRGYLSEHYRYSLDTKPFPPKSDSVSDFLFGSRTGYCVQFASSFTLLARLVGIPSRYVTGFLVNLPDDSDTTIVTGLSAHAWSEVWLEDRGWVTVEATPPLMPDSYGYPGYYSEFNPTNSEFTRRQLEAIAGDRVPKPPEPARPVLSLPLLPIGLGLGVILVLFLLLRALVLALLPRSRKVRRTIRRTVLRTNVLEIPDPSRRGWRFWANEVGRLTSRLPIMKRAAKIILELLFAARPPDARDALFLKRVHRAVRSLRRRSPASLHQNEH